MNHRQFRSRERVISENVMQPGPSTLCCAFLCALTAHACAVEEPDELGESESTGAETTGARAEQWVVGAQGSRWPAATPRVVGDSTVRDRAARAVVHSNPTVSSDISAFSNVAHNARGARTARARELAHSDTDTLTDDEISLAVDPFELAATSTGDTGADATPCQSTAQCPDGTQCIAMAADSMSTDDGGDGSGTCLAACVQANDAVIRCVDAEACCASDATCNQAGACVLPADSGPGESAGSDGCGGSDGCISDRDGDGVWDRWDFKPDESCKADADGDGREDSCDSNDMGEEGGLCSGGGLCGVARRGSHARELAFLVILLVIGRPGRARVNVCSRERFGSRT